jgi:deazaflavin-dependent oxidoreductase (nitroreductase family)
VLRVARLRPAGPGIVLRAGDRIGLLTPAPRTPGAAGDAALPAPGLTVHGRNLCLNERSPSVTVAWAARLLRTRWIVRAPVRLYRARLGFVFGSRLLMLEHTGRKTGIRRYAVLEVVDHPDPGTYIVAAGFGNRAQWLRNVRASLRVRVCVGARRPAPATARQLTPQEAAAALTAYARAHRGHGPRSSWSSRPPWAPGSTAAEPACP